MIETNLKFKNASIIKSKNKPDQILLTVDPNETINKENFNDEIDLTISVNEGLGERLCAMLGINNFSVVGEK